ncbi:MAG TPA: copper resistance protein NlpE N-terminal domain-containing protein [Flavobacterium sp.]|nr:copper resistance protein NlpE N-terminal domain-containing protein [Flavobacterium sp.]
MYWFKKISLIFIVVCGLTSCSEKEKAPVFIEPSLLDTIFNSAYEGMIPCPNCPGIETTIRIYNDSTVSRTVYYQESNRPLETKIGTWKLNDSVFIATFDREKLFYKIKNSALILRVGSDLKEVKGALSEDYALRKTLPFKPEQIEGTYVSGDSLTYHKMTIKHTKKDQFSANFSYVNALDSISKCEVNTKALLNKDHQLNVPLDEENGALKITFTKKEVHVLFKNIVADSVRFQCNDTLKMPSVEGIYKKAETIIN